MPKRQAEVACHKSVISEIDPQRVFFQNPYASEGTGDAVYDPYRDVIWASYVDKPSPATAYRGRSDTRAHRFMEEITGVKVISLPSNNGFYHIDTILAPLPRGHMLVVEDVLPDYYKDELYDRAFDRFGLDMQEYLIRVSIEDAHNLAANVRCFGNYIVMPKASRDLMSRIAESYAVLPVELNSFIAAGGALHCLSNNISEERVIGGRHFSQGHGPEVSVVSW